ncbi:unnamed protein product [Prunus armeniaca]
MGTRWNATYKLLDDTFKYKNVFTRMVEENAQFIAYFKELEKDAKRNPVKRVGPPTESDSENAQVFKDIFAFRSSMVASENVFSLDKRIVDPFRSSLTPKMVEVLVCTHDWLRVDEFNLYEAPTDEEIPFYKELEEIQNLPRLHSHSLMHQPLIGVWIHK